MLNLCLDFFAGISVNIEKLVCNCTSFLQAFLYSLNILGSVKSLQILNNIIEILIC